MALAGGQQGKLAWRFRVGWAALVDAGLLPTGVRGVVVGVVEVCGGLPDPGAGCGEVGGGRRGVGIRCSADELVGQAVKGDEVGVECVDFDAAGDAGAVRGVLGLAADTGGGGL